MTNPRNDQSSFPAPDPRRRLTETSPSTATPRPFLRRGALVVAAAGLCGALFGGAALVFTDDSSSAPEATESAVDDADAGVEYDRQLDEEMEELDRQAVEAMEEDLDRMARYDEEQRAAEEAAERKRAAQEAADELVEEIGPATSLEEICLTLHHFLTGENYPTVWKVKGTVPGAPDGTEIVVQGPTIHDGDPVSTEVVGGRFEAILGVDVYGDHPITRIDAATPDEVTSLLDDALRIDEISDGEHIVLPVGPEEGAVLGQECFDVPGDSPDAVPAPGEVDAIQAFLDELVELHGAEDAGGLAELLDPRVVEAFGERACIDQLVATTGSLLGLRVVSIDGQGPFTLDTSVGPIEFDDVVTVTVDMVTTAGEHRQQINLPVHHDHGWTWLTHCD